MRLFVMRARLTALLGLAPLGFPAIAVAVVAFTVLVVGRPRPVMGARLRGGPTLGARFLSYRLEVVERLGDVETPVVGQPADVQVDLPGGQSLDWKGVLDTEGAGAVTFPEVSAPISGNVRCRVRVADRIVADASFSLTRDGWARRAQHRGGFVEGRPTSAFAIRAAAERGAFAVPFRDPLWIEIRHPGLPLDGLHVESTADGAAVDGPPFVPGLPRSRVFLTPSEHAATLTIAATTKSGVSARLEMTLLVIPGALHAELSDAGVVIESPILRDRAYVAIVTPAERVGGGTVVLTPDGKGGAKGVLPLPATPPGPLWAVVSSEPELASVSLVGWPIRYDQAGAEPPRTFDVSDVLVVDSVGEAVLRETARVRGLRVRAAAFAVLSFALTALLLARRSHAANAKLAAHLGDEGLDQESTIQVVNSGGGSVWFVVVAVLAFVLAAVLVSIFALYR
jgi:hypothetical protein